MHINFQKLTHHQSFWQTFFSKFRPPTLLRPCFDLASPLLRTNSVSIPYQFRINSVKLALFTELVRNKHGINLDLYACKGEDEAKMIGGKGLCREWGAGSGDGYADLGHKDWKRSWFFSVLS